ADLTDDHDGCRNRIYRGRAGAGEQRRVQIIGQVDAKRLAGGNRDDDRRPPEGRGSSSSRRGRAAPGNGDRRSGEIAVSWISHRDTDDLAVLDLGHGRRWHGTVGTS